MTTALHSMPSPRTPPAVVASGQPATPANGRYGHGPAQPHGAHHDGMARLALRGELSLADGARLLVQLQDLAGSGARTLHVDMSAVTQVDAAVARLLLRFSWRVHEGGQRLLVVHAPRQVRRMLRWIGADELLRA